MVRARSRPSVGLKPECPWHSTILPVVTEVTSPENAARMRECAGMSLGYTLHGSRYARLSEKDAVTRPALGNALQLVLPAAVCPDRLAP